MNRDIAFWRKVIYISAIAGLLIPLYILGSPSRREKGDVLGGGYLADLRGRYGLAQGGLGEVDPAGEAMRLACLGMRGVATNILWAKANYYKKTEQFDNMAATVDQITKLQPNFIKIWEFQAHNLSFNTSVEYDDYHFRYHWVIRGLEFLMRGIRYNRDEPPLLWSLGWFTEQKIGRSDERRQFRELFREDDEYHDLLRQHIKVDKALGPDRRPDNWLVAEQWMLKAQDAVDNKGASIGGKSPLVFHSSPSMALMYYAMAIEEDGYLDEVGRMAWVKAGQSWKQYGSRSIATSYGFRIRLNNKEDFERQIEELVAELDELLPGAREKLRKKKYEKDLTDDERTALEAPQAELTPQQTALARRAEEKVTVTHQEVAQTATGEVRDRARRLASRIAEKDWRKSVIAQYRDIVNFEYWRTRCEVEQTLRAIDARKYVQQADQAFNDLDLVQAKDLYEKAWQNWAKIFEMYPSMLEQPEAEDVVDSIKRYRRCLVQLNEPFPDPFILQRLLDLHDRTSPKMKTAQPAEKPQGEKDADVGPAENSRGEDGSEQPADSGETDAEPTDGTSQPAAAIP